VTYASTDYGYILMLEPGDELVRCLIQFAREQEVDAAVVTGIGSVSEVELGAGGELERDRRRSVLTEPLDACSLTGTLTLLDGEPFPHVHGCFARADHSVIGGHVFQALCNGALEIAVQVTEPIMAGALARLPMHRTPS
jgi:predicted DNA-binding protein with PD1-like motif